MPDPTLVEGVSDTGVSDAELAAEARAVAKIKAVQNPPIDGVHVKLCGVEAVVPPLKALHLRKFKDSLEQIRKATDDVPVGDFIEFALPVIHAALSRNYPELTLADAFQLIDADSIRGALFGMLARSGYRATQPGE